MAKLNTSGKDTSIKVPYQKPVAGARVIKAPSKEAEEFNKQFSKDFRLTLRALAEK